MKVTDRRTNQDFAECMRELVDVDYPDAPIIRVVMDNLSTHSAGALYDAFPAPEARRVLKRLQFHHTPKHASWLNMVEIEIGVLRSQCLDRRIDDKETILAEVAAWQQRRNAEGAQIQWMFTTEKAREKLRKAYPVNKVIISVERTSAAPSAAACRVAARAQAASARRAVPGAVRRARPEYRAAAAIPGRRTCSAVPACASGARGLRWQIGSWRLSRTRRQSGLCRQAGA